MNVDFSKIELGNLIGAGTYGDVYNAKLNTKDGEKTIAAKKLRLRDTSNKELDRELENLSRCKHENIVKMYGVTEGKDSMIYLLLEYAECGSLYDFLHSEEKKNIQISYLAKHSWMHQCAKGIAYLHERGIVHRDLKTQNLLLFNNNRTLKLCDFGTVKQITSKMTKEVGTAYCMAPEVALGNPYDSKCDVYSFGIIFWEVMARRKPYYELKDFPELTILKKVADGHRPPLADIQNYKYLKPISSIIEKCWHENPTNRPTMKGLCFTLGLNPYSFGDNLELITEIQPLPEINDTCFKENTN